MFMKDVIDHLLAHRTLSEVYTMLHNAEQFARTHRTVTWHILQEHLHVGHGEAEAILDWLSDTHQTDPLISNHEIRCGRRYVMNTPFPSLEEMAKTLGTGDRRAYAIMLELERRRVVRIGTDFEMLRIKRMSRWSDLVRQLKWVSKKYGGRCDASLLMRILYVDAMTAVRLAQYGEENLGLVWKDRPRKLK